MDLRRLNSLTDLLDLRGLIVQMRVSRFSPGSEIQSTSLAEKVRLQQYQPELAAERTAGRLQSQLRS